MGEFARNRKLMAVRERVASEWIAVVRLLGLDFSSTAKKQIELTLWLDTLK